MTDSDVQEGSEIDRYRRNDIAKEALQTGMEDPLWLHNIAVKPGYHDGHAEMKGTVEDLRRRANVIEKAHNRLKNGEFTGAEASVFIARRVDCGDYDIMPWLEQEMPITEEP